MLLRRRGAYGGMIWNILARAAQGGAGENCMCNRWREWFRYTCANPPEAPPEQKVTYRDIVFWTVFTEAWR